MAEIRPFRGLHYNQSLANDLSAVICPPYDIIPPQQLEELHQRSEYNFVRLEAGRELPADTDTDNKYTRSAATLEQWLNNGILEVDETPAIYLHDHCFMHQGKEYRRRGITVRVRLEEWDKMVIRPHEGTLAEPRDDRLNLLCELQANTSPILVLFEDGEQQVGSLLVAQERNKPLISSSGTDEERHTVWAITEPEVVKQISDNLAHQPLYIADGHHRYSSALAYRHDRRAYSPLSPDEAVNFVMMTLVDFADPGLVILPPHRLVRGISRPILDSLTDRLEVFFEVDRLPLNTPNVWQRVDTLLAQACEGSLVYFGAAAEELFVLRLRDFAAASEIMPYFHSELYKRLDVSIVDHVILEKLLELETGSDESKIGYSYDRQDTINRVLKGGYQLAFLLSPVKTELIKAIADDGDKMPRKSTYFYPKAPAGLVLNRLV